VLQLLCLAASGSASCPCETWPAANCTGQSFERTVSDHRTGDGETAAFGARFNASGGDATWGCWWDETPWILDPGRGVEITALTPTPTPTRDGFLVDPALGARHGFDDRAVAVSANFDPAFRRVRNGNLVDGPELPFTLNPAAGSGPPPVALFSNDLASTSCASNTGSPAAGTATCSGATTPAGAVVLDGLSGGATRTFTHTGAFLPSSEVWFRFSFRFTARSSSTTAAAVFSAMAGSVESYPRVRMRGEGSTVVLQCGAAPQEHSFSAPLATDATYSLTIHSDKSDGSAELWIDGELWGFCSGGDPAPVDGYRFRAQIGLYDFEADELRVFPSTPFVAVPPTQVVVSVASRPTCYLTGGNTQCLKAAHPISVVSAVPAGNGREILRPPIHGHEKPQTDVSTLPLSTFPLVRLTALSDVENELAFCKATTLDFVADGAKHIPKFTNPGYGADLWRRYVNCPLRIFDLGLTEGQRLDFARASLQISQDVYYGVRNGRVDYFDDAGFSANRLAIAALGGVLLNDAAWKAAFRDRLSTRIGRSLFTAPGEEFGEDGSTYVSSVDPGSVLWGDRVGACTQAGYQNAWNAGTGKRTCRDPWQQIDGGERPGSVYQSCCSSAPFRANVALAYLFPGMTEVLAGATQVIFDYVERWDAQGGWAPPSDPISATPTCCAPGSPHRGYQACGGRDCHGIHAGGGDHADPLAEEVWRSAVPFLRTTGMNSWGQVTFGALADADRDGDRVLDGDDNCSAADQPNLDQRDADADGYGNSCDPDFDQNLVVGASDFTTFRGCFGRKTPAAGGPAADPTCEESDLDGNGAVGGGDFAILRRFLGLPPGPSGLAP
jgi:hypothetical protein